MAAIIGTCLMESGAAMRIVRSSLSVFGEKKAPEAMAGSSFLLGIPVFFDTLFYLMVPLAKALALQTKKLSTLCFGHRGGWSHDAFSRPANPGPLLVAGELEVDLGRMIVGGLIVGSFGMAGAFAYADGTTVNTQWRFVRWMNRTPVSFRRLPKSRKLNSSLFFSLSPLALPVLLIAGNSILSQTSFESVVPVGVFSKRNWFSWRQESCLNHGCGFGSVALVAFSRIPGVTSRSCGEEITQKRGDDHLDYGDGWSLRRHFTTNFPRFGHSSLRH